MSYIPKIGPATSTTQGLVKLAGDLGGSADAPTVTKVQGVSYESTAPTAAGQVMTYNGTNAAWATVPAASDASTTAKGAVQLAGDLGGTAAAPTVQKIKGGIMLPSTTPTTGQVLTATSGAATAWSTPTSTAAATTTSTGTITLAGDLGGTAAAPTVPALANKIDTDKIGVANGVASLDASGDLPFAQLPALSNIVMNPTSGYMAQSGDYILASATSGELIINLPTAAKGARVSVKKIDTSTNSVTIKATTAIDDKAGTSGFSLPTQWWSQDFLSDGTQWYCI